MNGRGDPRLSRRRMGMGGPAALPTDARHMLRAIRDQVDDQGTYAGSDANAARLAGVSVDAARRSLQALAGAGLLRLRRTKGQ